MYKELARLGDATEESYALEFEEAAFITLGFCYENRPRFSGGAYNPILRRVDGFLKKTLREALEIANAAASVVIHQLGTTGTATVSNIGEKLTGIH